MNTVLTLVFYTQFLLPGQMQTASQFAAGEFKSVIIGEQEWMAVNWNFKTPKSFFYNNDSTLDGKYGRLYFYSNAVASTPKGWHLPTMDEWWALVNYLGGPNSAGKRMMEGGDSGLNLPFAGYKSANISDEDLFGFIDHYAFYWTSTQDGEQTAYAIHIDNNHVITMDAYRRANGFSVRYVKDK